MKIRRLLWLFGILLAATQEPTNAQTKPATVSRKNIEITDQNELKFNLFAPFANQVFIAGWDIMSFYGKTKSGQKPFRGIPMQKTENGYWSINLGKPPAEPLQYFYWIDSVRTVDPENAQILSTANQPLSVADLVCLDSANIFCPKAVPRGMVVNVFYYSNQLNKLRPLSIYLPPDYFTATKAYPVLYLLHGAGEIATSWVNAGKANIVADNLLASGKMLPTIIVMPLGHPIGEGDVLPSAGSSINRQPWFEKELTDEIIPWIEKNFRTKNNKADRALAGLSMGGAQSIYTACRNPGLFNYVYILSAGDQHFEVNQAAFLANARQTGSPFKKLFLGVGNLDKVGKNETNPGVYDNMLSMHNLLTRYNIVHDLKILPDTDHTWYAWRNFLANDVLPTLWK
jgi:enterochelin esterase family protein